MSRELIARSTDLTSLEANGYSLRIVDDAYLVVDRVQYVTASRQVGQAELIMVLTLQGDRTATPGDHVAYWSGTHPYRANGTTLDALLLPSSQRTSVCPSFPSVLMFSAKTNYRDYFHKVTTYVGILKREVQLITREIGTLS